MRGSSVALQVILCEPARMRCKLLLLGCAFVAACVHGVSLPVQSYQGPDSILNVSYDVSRELFGKVNEAFVAAWQHQGGRKVEIRQSHGGTSAQAKAVLGGLEADVVTFNQVLDVQMLHDQGQWIADGWRERLPKGSAPFYSFPAFLVRKGNPKRVQGWGDLVRADVKSVMPDPRTSGNARYSYLAAYAHALAQHSGDQAKAKDFARAFFANVVSMEAGGRAATTAFVERGIGDVLITFESEVHGVQQQHPGEAFAIVVPDLSVQADFPVSVVDRNVEKHGTRQLAEAYLQFLFGKECQEIAASFFLRVRDAEVASRHQGKLPPVKLVTVEAVFGGWDKVQAEHFAEGRILDQVLGKR